MRRERGRILWGRGGGRRMVLRIECLGGLWFVGADVLGAVLSISSTPWTRVICLGLSFFIVRRISC